MAAGLAVPDAQLAASLFEQACFDLLNGERLLKERNAKALSVAQFQQACEKAVKAFVLYRVGRRRYGDEIRPSHAAWSLDLCDGRLTTVRQEIQSAFDGWDLDELEKLERLAPQMGWTNPNPEYPWVGENSVFSPARYFETREMEIAAYARVARRILRILASKAASFDKAWKTVGELNQ